MERILSDYGAASISTEERSRSQGMPGGSGSSGGGGAGAAGASDASGGVVSPGGNRSDGEECPHRGQGAPALPTNSFPQCSQRKGGSCVEGETWLAADGIIACALPPP